MTAILYGVSPIGLGHASRAAAVGMKLREQDVDVEFATGGNAASFLGSYGFKVNDIVTAPTPLERRGVMRYPALWYLRYWRGYRSTRTRMLALMDQTKPRLVVGDEEFSSVSLALERGLATVLITDELELGFARTFVSRYIEHRVSEWYTRLQRRVAHLLVPDFGSDYGNVRFVTPVVRTATRNRKEVFESLKIRQESKMILLSASGSGIGRFLLESALKSLDALGLPDVKLVVTGPIARRSSDEVLYLGVYRDNQDLVAAADLVISTAGKSTIDEAASFGSPIIALPIKRHYEQERNAASVGFVPDDVSRLRELIPRFLGRRTVPKNYLGAESIAMCLRSLA